MFLPPKLITILLGQLIALTMLSASVSGQNSEFERRLAALQEARARAQATAVTATVSDNGGIASKDVGVDYTDPPSPPKARVASRAGSPPTARKRRPAPAPPIGGTPTHVRVAQGPGGSTYVPEHLQEPGARVAQGSGSTYVPQHLQGSGSTVVPQQLQGSGTSIVPQEFESAPTYIDDGSYVVDSGSPVISSSCDCGSCHDGGVVIGESYVDEGYVVDSCSSCCNSCGGGGAYGPYCSSCLPLAQALGQCYLNNLSRGVGALVYNAEFFGGATAFRSPLFETPGGGPGELSDDRSQGFFGGFNLGFPLNGLTGGLLSGQVGIRSVQTNFNGNEFTTENRDQLFITAGVFRRVDFGFQGGIVADILHEEWFTENDLVQLRGEAGWVFGGGRSFGFRFATNTQDDITSGTFAGNSFTDLITSTDDNYRFFIRSERPSSGYGEIFVGWSDLEQTIVGLDFDVAVTQRIGVQAGFTYFLTDEGLPAGTTNLAGGNAEESFNIFVGFVLRPRGRSYYDSYDRPLFSVADNGSFLITRENQ